MIFVDTGFLVALAQKNDELHARATAWAAGEPELLVTTDYVLWEMFNALSKPVDRRKAHENLAYVRTAENWEVVPAAADLFEKGIALHSQRDDKSWSLTDCISFLVMRDRGIHRALTNDHDFEQAGYEALLRRDPP